MARLRCTAGILIRLSTEKEKYVDLKIEKRVTRDEHEQIGRVN